MTVQQLKDKIAANSAAWHKTDDDRERQALHEENKVLYGMLDGQTGTTSAFDSATGRWTSTQPGEGPYQGRSSPQVSSQEEALEARQQAATEGAVLSLTRAREAQEGALKDREEAISDAYRKARNAAAAQSEIARKNAGEWASDRGLSSGAAGQAALAQSVAAQGELSALEAQEGAAYDQLGRDRYQMERDYALAVAEAQAEGDYALADALYREAVRYQEARRQQWKDREEQALDIYALTRSDREKEAAAAQAAEQREYDRGQNALEWQYKAAQALYQRERDELDRALKQESLDWQRAKDSASLSIRRQQMANTQAQRAFENQRKLAKDLAQSGDFQGYSALGYSQSQIDSMEGMWRIWKSN